MNDRDALYNAILAQPDEDTPRLALADWLDENGDAKYAAFIREQVELAKGEEWDSRWLRAWHGPREMTTGRTFTAFQPELPTGVSWPTLETFRRGFPWHVQTVEPAPFLKIAEQLYRQIPLQALTVHADNARWREPIKLDTLFASPHLEPIKQLTFSLTRFNPDTAKQLRDCPRLPNLHALRFEYATLDAGAARDMLKSPLIEKLETLEFSATTVPWSEIAAAFRDAGTHRLRRFKLVPFSSTYFSFSKTFNAPFLAGLRELEISKCEMGEEHTRTLCESAAVRELESLSLVATIPGVPGLKALAGCASLGKLKRLSLGGNRLGPVAIKNLARSPHFGNLQVLNLTGNPLGDKGAVELSRAPWLKNLILLDLMHCDIADAGLEALLDALDPDKLIHLNAYSSDYRSKQSDRVKKKLREKFPGRVFV